MKPEIITLIGTLVNSIFLVVNSFVLYSLNKKSKSFEIGVGEIHELNIKMHDRLVEVEDAIKSEKYPSDSTRKRLLYNASRLMKYDVSILNDVNLLIKDWAVMLSLKDRGSASSGEISKSKSKMIDLIKKIKEKVDKLQKNL